MSRTACHDALESPEVAQATELRRLSKERAADAARRTVFMLRRIRGGVWADIPETPVFPTEGKALDWARHNGPLLKPEKGDGFNVFRVIQAPAADAVLSAA
ncbi:hypothetical protein [Zavarzinia sp. CC-PAN008]|uniref:hypothetical protein n=1 Tax=Zavarzinia sp. CC-PAN008 TaxID=3243332 RepID=UPI003F747907